MTLDALAHFLRPLLALCQIGFYIFPMTQIVGDDGIDISQRRSGVTLCDGFRGRAILERVNHQFQQNTRAPDAEGPRLIPAQWWSFGL